MTCDSNQKAPTAPSSFLLPFPFFNLFTNRHAYYNRPKMAEKRRQSRTSVNEAGIQPNNPLQSDFGETASMDSDERYLV